MKLACPGVWIEPRINGVFNEKRTTSGDKIINSVNSTSNNTELLPELDDLTHIPDVLNDERGDLLCRNFWANGSDCIFDIRVSDTDAPSYIKLDPVKVIENQEKQKKQKYLQSCLDQRRQFTPVVLSIDGLLGQETKSIVRRLSLKLAQKWRTTYNYVIKFINSRLSIAIVRATHLCLRGSRVPIKNITSQRFHLEDEADMRLYNQLI